MRSSLLLGLGCLMLLAYGCGGSVALGGSPGDGGTMDATTEDAAGSSSGADSGSNSGGSSGSSGSSSGAGSSSGSGSSSGGISDADTGPDFDGYPDSPPYEYVDAGFPPSPGQDASVPVPDGGSTLGQFAGYFENYTFPSGSDAVFMNLVLAPDGTTVTGIVVLGSGTPPAPPTQPDVGWPPGFKGNVTVIEGWALTVLQGTLSAGRLTLGVDQNEPWNEWCEIQPSYLQPNAAPGTYRCTPDTTCGFSAAGSCGAGSPYGACQIDPCDGGASFPVDCCQWILCGGMGGPGLCSCTASGCSHPLSTTMHFEMQLTPMHLDGSTTGLTNGAINVHLVQQ